MQPDRSSNGAGGANRDFVGAETEVGETAHREPARWGLVVLDPPRVVDGELRQASLGAVSQWSDGTQRFTDDRPMRLFHRLSRLVGALFVGTVDGASRATGVAQHYPGIRLLLEPRRSGRVRLRSRRRVLPVSFSHPIAMAPAPD